MLRACELTALVSDSLPLHELQPTRLLCPQDSPGKDTEWVAISSSGDLPNPGIEPTSLTLPALTDGFLATGPRLHEAWLTVRCLRAG